MPKIGMADPKYPAPNISVFEKSKHDWVQIDGAVKHFQQSNRPPFQTETLPEREISN
jgi:hypothetical protein